MTKQLTKAAKQSRATARQNTKVAEEMHREDKNRKARERRAAKKAETQAKPKKINRARRRLVDAVVGSIEVSATKLYLTGKLPDMSAAVLAIVLKDAVMLGELIKEGNAYWKPDQLKAWKATAEKQQVDGAVLHVISYIKHNGSQGLVDLQTLIGGYSDDIIRQAVNKAMINGRLISAAGTKYALAKPKKLEANPEGLTKAETMDDVISYIAFNGPQTVEYLLDHLGDYNSVEPIQAAADDAYTRGLLYMDGIRYALTANGKNVRVNDAARHITALIKRITTPPLLAVYYSTLEGGSKDFTKNEITDGINLGVKRGWIAPDGGRYRLGNRAGLLALDESKIPELTADELRQRVEGLQAELKAEKEATKSGWKASDELSAYARRLKEKVEGLELQLNLERAQHARRVWEMRQAQEDQP